MHRSCNSARGPLFVALAILGLFGALRLEAAPAQAPAGDEIKELRKRALALYDENKKIEALPHFERLVQALPADAVVHERLASCLIAYSATLADEEASRQALVRARQLLVRSRELGNNSNLMHALLEMLPEDGRIQKFSSRSDVDAAIREGEAAFARNDMDAAAAAYRRALALDPQNFHATLFLGDVYFSRKDWENAARWFSLAAQIDPSQEAGHRYWGDALMGAGKLAEARARFIDAVIAEPYYRRAWNGILQWARMVKVQLSHPRIDSPGAARDEKGQTNITIDASTLEATDGSQHWVLYAGARAWWSSTGFKEKFPGEQEYRHTLAEEADSLRTVIDALRRDLKSGEIRKLNPQLADLLKLDDAGLLEAYVLFARADEGIARDYVNYRAENREKLRRYLDEWVVPRKW
jgi:tetratricopeptide (TPR) repeat protein